MGAETTCAIVYVKDNVNLFAHPIQKCSIAYDAVTELTG